VRKENYFHDFDGPGWPAADELKKYFSAELWVSSGRNDHWALRAEGLRGTQALSRNDSVNVELGMVGSPDHGVLLQYVKWDGRIQHRDCYLSKGDLSRLGRFMYNLHDDPYSLALFIPFEQAFKAVKQFIETDGELPNCIEWVAARDLPPDTFPDPAVVRHRLPG